MKKLLISFFLVSTQFVFGQVFKLTGVVIADSSVLEGCNVVNKTTNAFAITNNKGEYSIDASVGDNIHYSYFGYKSITKKIIDFSPINILLIEDEPHLEQVVVSSPGPSLSMSNFWTGAKVGYNFTANTDDNFFVGSASISLNLLNLNSRRHKFGIVGNIGNFKFTKDSTDTSNVQKLAQSINGLLIGLGYTNERIILGEETADKKRPVTYFRKFILSGARLTTFKNVGIDSLTVNFTQSVTTAGLEFEQAGFANGGSLTASVGLSLMLFDKKQYKMIFDEEKGSLVILDATIILPLSKNIGFFVNGTFAKKTSGAYIVGVVFK